MLFSDVIERLKNESKTKLLHNLKSELGLHPIYEIDYKGQKVAVFQPGIGAPMAAAIMEDVIALGARKFITCEGAGVLDKEFAVEHIIVPNATVRDEGISYHYIMPSREIKINTDGIKVIEKVLSKHKCKYIVSKTWTTDAFYRETERK